MDWLKSLKGVFRKLMKMVLPSFLRLKLIEMVVRFKNAYDIRLVSSVLQRRYEKTLKKIHNKEILTVLFYSPYNQTANTFLPVFKEMERNERFDPIVFVLPPYAESENPGEGYQDNLRYFESIGLKYRLGYDLELCEYVSPSVYGADIIFYEAPYSSLNTVYPSKISIRKASKYSLSCYIIYGFILDAEHNFAKTLPMPFHSWLWQFYIESNDHMPYYKKYSSGRLNNVKSFGWPRFDDVIYNSTDRCNELWKVQNATSRVIWAPHQSISYEGSINFSTFEWNYKLLLDIAKEYPSIDWIVRPHPMLKNRVVEVAKFMTQVEYDKYFSEWEKLPNVQLVAQGDYLPFFNSSDVLITDSLSFLPEYLLTGKPIIHLYNPRSAGYNDVAEKILSGNYRVENEDEFNEVFLQLIIKGNDYRKKKRLISYDYLRSISPKNTSFQIVENLLGEIN